MANSTFTPAKTSQSRVFLIEGRARPDHKPSYQSCIRMMGVSQGFGDIERIEAPDPTEYGKFVEVGQIRGATERVTTSLEGRYALEIKSVLMEMARKGCAADVQLHFGSCTDPSDPDTFTKALVLESAYLTNYSTEDMGALASGDDAAVNETSDVSARQVYEILPISFGEKAGSIVTNEIIDVAVADTASCGDCDTESDGCKKIFALSIAAGGSPGTPADIVYSIDKGTTWYAHDIDTLATAEAPSAVDAVGAYLVVVALGSNSLHYALKSEFDGVTDPAWTEVATGFVTGGEPKDMFSTGNKAFVVGQGGYIYSTEDVTAGVTVIDAGVATVDTLLSVHALTDDFAVAVGNNGAVVYTENGTTWAAATRPVGVGVNLNCVWIKSTREWWVGTSTGLLYYTLNGGQTWTLKSFPGSGSGSVLDISFSTDSVGYLSHQTAATKGRILRSYNGGYSWKVVPERSGATLPVNDKINALGTCTNDPNFVVGVGLADNGTDGFVVLGLAS